MSEGDKNAIRVTIRIRPLNERERSEGALQCVKVDPTNLATLILETQ